MTSATLAALPGSSTDPGSGPAVVELFERLLDDAIPESASTDAVVDALAAHRDHRRTGHADLVGPLTVPAALAESLVEALSSADHGLPVVLAAPADGPHEAARQVLRGARDLLAEDDRVELVGVRLGLPEGPSGQATERLLDTLDFSATAWVLVAPGAAADDALRVLAEDGAESLALALDGATPDAVARTLRQAVDLELTFRAVASAPGLVTGSGTGTGTGATRIGVLNLLCAVRAALNGAQPPQLADVLACPQAAPLVSALRRMSAADAAVTRALLAGVTVPSVEESVAALLDLELVSGS